VHPKVHETTRANARSDGGDKGVEDEAAGDDCGGGGTDDDDSKCEELDDGNGTEDGDEDQRVNNLKTLTKDALLVKYEELRKKMAEAEYAAVNTMQNMTNVQRDNELKEGQILDLRESIRQWSSNGSASSDMTVQTFATSRATSKEVVAVAEDFTKEDKGVLVRVIREWVFRKHKITTLPSFKDGEIQQLCHRKLAPELRTDEMMAAHRHHLIKLVNLELAQKRNNVNKKLLREWVGKSSCSVPLALILDR
jgi:hypothetical protein